eukprot:scaffold121875_cov44-Prasinocladus_malaysianus.AAC.3
MLGTNGGNHGKINTQQSAEEDIPRRRERRMTKEGAIISKGRKEGRKAGRSSPAITQISSITNYVLHASRSIHDGFLGISHHCDSTIALGNWVTCST